MSDQQAMLKNFVFAADRPTIVGLLNGETVPLDVLRGCAFIALGGDPGLLAEGMANVEVAPKATAPKAAPKATTPAAAPKATPKANGARGEVADLLDTAIAVFVEQGVGFAKSDLVKACGGKATPNQASAAIKRAVANGDLANYGDRRWSRYGANVAIAKMASEAAKAG